MSTFYVTGGTLHPDAPSYVERQADLDLLEGLRRGEFCYVLTSRQMGKSSLMVRTANKLRAQAADVAVLDLTAIGQNLSPEQWYDGLLARMGRQLGLEDELDRSWREHQRLSPVQRWFAAIRDVVLTCKQGPVVIFVDEIDTVRSLPFSTDEFFAAIRECYNRRTEDAGFNRVTFCLLGVATPSDLIRDTRMTPFNIGRRIELHDFSEEEALPLAQGLEPIVDVSELGRGRQRAAQTLLKRVLYWTRGHPYLTQRLCQAVAEACPSTNGGQDPNRVHFRLLSRCRKMVDRLCAELFLSSQARERDDNLIFVRERLLRCEADLADLLTFYKKIRDPRQRVPNDETNRLENLLRLAGIVRAENGILCLRNRIYERAFDRAWIKVHMPDAERRRQREAYLKGIVRATTVILLVAGIVFFQMRHAQTTATRRLADSFVDTGTRLANEGDLLGSLPWYARALELDAGDREREQRDRIHVALTLKQCPKIIRLWFVNQLIYDIGFSPDGRYLVTASEDNTARVWDTEEEDKQVLQLVGHTNDVQSAAYSPDGRYLVTASTDHTVRIWDARTGKEMTDHPLEHPAWVYGARFDPMAKRVATACADGIVRIWDWRAGKTLQKCQGHGNAVLFVAFSPEGQRVVSASKDHTARIWEAETGQAIGQPFRHESWVYQALFSPNGRYVLTGSFDNKAVLWDIETSQSIRRWEHEKAVRSVDFSPDGRYVVTAGWDFTVRVSDVATGKAVGPPLKVNGSVFRVCFSPDGHRLAAAGLEGVVFLWSLAPVHWQPPLVEGIYSQDGTRLAIVRGKEIRVVDAFTQEPVCPTLVAEHSVATVQFTRNGQRLLALSTNSNSPSQTLTYAEVWTSQTGQLLSPAFVCGTNLTRVGLGEDGDHLLSLAKDAAQLWHATNGTVIAALPGVTNITESAFDPVGKFLALVAETNVTLVEAATGRTVHLFEHSNEVTHAEFSPSGRHLLTSCITPGDLYGEAARIWAVPSGRCVETLFHRDGLLYASYAPDGRGVVTACEDFTAQFWKLPGGQKLTLPLKHKFQVSQARFSPNGRWIVTAAKDKTVRIWETATSIPITPPLKHRESVLSAQFVAGQRHVLTRQGKEAGFRLWDLSPDPRPLEQLSLLTRVVSQHEIDEIGSEYPLDRAVLQKAWAQLRSQPEFQISEQEVINWQEREAELSKAQTDRGAALFHLNQLLRIQPDNARFRALRDQAEQE
jgi:WD40 repeat protein